jgi:cation diffusion facilitator CzcD-associated flavoprotein CzcO
MSLPTRITNNGLAAPTDAAPGETRHVRVAIVGAGFSGLGLAIRLKQEGIEDFAVLERAGDIGGTWRDNTYPGCACDVPSHLYSFSFAPNPDWSRTYSPRREIWDYLRHCAVLYGIIPHIQFNTEVRDAAWDEVDQRWRITTSKGMLTADIFVLGNGPLSEPRLPDIPGIETFAGTLFHSGRWDHTHDLTDERVAVIGTGASAIQVVPRIQPQVGHLTLFQRTPPWILPRNDQAISERDKALFHALPLTQRLQRVRIYLRNELTALFMVYKPEMMKKAEALSLHHLEKQVADPELRAKLTPTYTMGCKRILLSDDFYPALTQDNVEVATERIREVRPHSIVTVDGVEREVDTILVATGFHVTDMPAAGYVRGRGGQTLAEVWRDSPQAYLGTTVSGFPNLFLMIGPNTGLGHTSMVYMIESQLAYVLDCLRLMERRGLKAVEVRTEAQAAYNDEIQRRLRGTVWMSGCKSWYLDAHGRNTALWPGFTFEYRWRTRRFDAASYELALTNVPSGVVVSQSTAS